MTRRRRHNYIEREGTVVTFYSYKGGVGRTMALVNTACLLAKDSKKVLVIDWDLEAPGINHFFNDNRQNQPGLIDLFVNLNQLILENQIHNDEQGFVECFDRVLNEYIIKDFPIVFKNEKQKYFIDIIKSGRFDSDYSNKISSFDWFKFYSNSPNFFRTFALYLGTQYDYILIDSRTGYADTSGICTMLMPERLVLIFAPNEQNLEGVIEVAKQVKEYRLESSDDRTIAFFPLPSRIDSNNTTQRPIWFEKYSKRFEKFFNEYYFLNKCDLRFYFEKASIRYIHDYAYGENIPVLDESTTDNKNISNDYSNFLSILIQNKPIWEIISPESLIDIEISKFIDTESNPSIKIIGVGGGGSNAVTHMFKQGISDVDFYICNTDVQSLSVSPIPNKISLGASGLGIGSNPSIGRDAALYHENDIYNILNEDTKMLFIVAGMGGGIGTGASPVIAKIARELGILTIGVVTKPFGFEGRKRMQQAEDGINLLKDYVDTILVINNDRLLDLQGDLKLSQAFGKADDILTIAVKGISKLLTTSGRINVDFEDAKSILGDSGKAIMGVGIASGKDRAVEAVMQALLSPLLEDTDIKAAEHLLLYISSGRNEISLEELNEITGYITDEAGENSNVFWGDGVDESLDDEIAVTLIATGFDSNRETVISELPIETKERQKKNFKRRFENIEDENEALRNINDERSSLKARIDELKKEILILKNNLPFIPDFKVPKLPESDFNAKIARAKEELASLEVKKKSLQKAAQEQEKQARSKK